MVKPVDLGRRSAPIATLLSTRIGRILASAVSSAGGRALSIVLSLVTVPIALGHLGPAGYGLWATITAFVAIQGFADLGLGSGLMQSVSAALGRDDRDAIRRSVSNALALLSGIGLLLLATFFLVYPVVPWARVIGADAPQLAAVAGPAMAAFAIVFALSLPTGVVQRLQFALQQGYLAGITQAVGSMLTLVLVLAVVKLDGQLLSMVVATMCAPLIAAVLAGLLMIRAQPALRPRRSDLAWDDARGLLRTGSKFLLLEITFVLTFASDNLVIAQVVGLEAVATYSVYQKIFSIPAIVAGFALTPLWAAYGEALARGDLAWIRRTFIRSFLLLGGLGAVGSVLLYLASGPLIDLWIGAHFGKDPALAIAFAVWIAVDMTGKAASMLLNGVGVLRQQVWLALAYLPICLGLKILLAQWYGAAGVPAAMAIAYAVTHIPAYWLIVSRWFAQTERNPPRPQSALSASEP